MFCRALCWAQQSDPSNNIQFRALTLTHQLSCELKLGRTVFVARSRRRSDPATFEVRFARLAAAVPMPIWGPAFVLAPRCPPPIVVHAFYSTLIDSAAAGVARVKLAWFWASCVASMGVLSAEMSRGVPGGITEGVIYRITSTVLPATLAHAL